MKTISKLVILSVLVAVLTSCNAFSSRPAETSLPGVTPTFKPTNAPTITFSPTVTPEPGPTVTSTPTKILATEPASTPRVTPLPAYQNKQVILNYYVAGNLSNTSMFFDPEESCCLITRLVLYDDGQMIIANRDEPDKQKVLSSGEMKQFLSKLENLGFYSLESNQQHDPTDKLYDFGNNYDEVNDGLRYCILVNVDRSKDLCVHESYLQFLIPKMKNILKYLDEYEPAGMTLYYPDRILLSVQSDPLLATVIPWDKHFPSLDVSLPQIYTWDNPDPVIYVDGEMAKKIYLFLMDTDRETVFSQNGREYVVYLRVLFPHEKVTNAAFQ